MEENLDVIRTQGKDVSRGMLKGLEKRKFNLEVKLQKIAHSIEQRTDDVVDFRCFDAWVAIFAKKTTDFEFNVTNNIVQKERFRYFIKVPELAAFYNEITDYRTAEAVGVDRPQKNERARK